MKRGRLMLVLTAAAVTVGAGPPVAGAATGDLLFGGCISGETLSPACQLLPSASADGQGSGLDGDHAIAASPDGRSVYAVGATTDDAVAHFTRDPATGALAFAGCVTGGTTPPCVPIPSAVASGADSGFDDPEAVAVSPDGASVHVAADGDDSIVHLRRDAASGALSFVSCVTGNTDAAGACQALATASADGGESGLDSPEGLAISPDGRFVYALATGDAGVAAFALGNGGGLAYAGCVSAETESDPACDLIPGAAPDADLTGLSSLRGFAMSSDGRSLYTADDSDDGVAHFQRDPATGSLTFAGCLTADSLVVNCEKLPGSVPGANGTGLDSLISVGVSPDGTSVYVVGDGDDSLIHYRRDPASGAIAFESCLSNSTDTTICAPAPAPNQTGLDFAVGVAVAPDARSVYAIGGSADAVAAFARDPATGTLSPRGCLSSRLETTGCAPLPGATSDGLDSGFDEPRGLVATADGRSLYVASRDDDAVARFDREPDTSGPALVLAGERRVKDKRVKVNATCTDEFCTVVDATAKLTVKLKRKGKRRKRASLKPATATDLQPGQAAPLTLALNRKGKRLLRKAGKGKVTVSASAADLLDNRSSAKRKVKLNRKRKGR